MHGCAAYRFISIIISERASDHEAYSAGARVTWALEKSRTLICVASNRKCKGVSTETYA